MPFSSNYSESSSNKKFIQWKIMNGKPFTFPSNGWLMMMVVVKGLYGMCLFHVRWKERKSIYLTWDVITNRGIKYPFVSFCLTGWISPAPFMSANWIAWIKSVVSLYKHPFIFELECCLATCSRSITVSRQHH